MTKSVLALERKNVVAVDRPSKDLGFQIIVLQFSNHILGPSQTSHFS